MLPNRQALLFSAKCFAAALLAMYIAFAAGLPRPYWAMASVYIASQTLSGATLSKAAFRLLGTLLGAAASVILIPNLVDSPALLSLALAAWVGGCLYLSLLNRRPSGYVFMLAGYSAAIIGFPSVATPGLIFDTAVARVQEISLGIVCAAAAHALVLPTPVGPFVSARLGDGLRLVQGWAANALIGDDNPAEGRRRLGTLLGELDTLDDFLAWDPTGRASPSRPVRQFRWRLLLLMPVVASIRDRVGALCRENALTPQMSLLLSDTNEFLSTSDADSAAVATALRARINAAEATLDAGADWPRLLTASLLLRLRDLTRLWQDCRQIGRHVRQPHAPEAAMSYVTDAQASAVRLADRGMALWSGLAAAAALLLCCALWILGAWEYGAVAAEMLAVTCSFFATRDDPVPMIKGFLAWTVVALAMDAVLLFAVLPLVHDFTTLALVLAPPFLFCGVLMGMPATSFVGMALVANGATLLSLDGTYDADFASFANAGVAAVLGMAMAGVVTAITRTVGEDVAARRLLRHARAELATAIRRRGRQDRGLFAARLLERLTHILPRLSAADAAQAAMAARLLADVRVGLNIVDLRRARHALPGGARATLDRMLDRLADHIAAPTDPAPVLEAIDAALGEIAALPDDAGRADALLGLVGIRCSLFPDAATYRPAAPMPVPLSEIAEAA